MPARSALRAAAALPALGPLPSGAAEVGAAISNFFSTFDGGRAGHPICGDEFAVPSRAMLPSAQASAGDVASARLAGARAPRQRLSAIARRGRAEAAARRQPTVAFCRVRCASTRNQYAARQSPTSRRWRRPRPSCGAPRRRQVRGRRHPARSSSMRFAVLIGRPPAELSIAADRLSLPKCR